MTHSCRKSILLVLVGIVGGGLCGAAILVFGGLIGRSGTAGTEYFGYWNVDTIWLGLLYGGFFGAFAGPLAHPFLIRKIGIQKSILPAFPSADSPGQLRRLPLQLSQESADSFLRSSGQESSWPRLAFPQINEIFFCGYVCQRPVTRQNRRLSHYRELRSFGFHIGYANDYALSKRPGCPSDRIESHRNILRVQQAIQL